MSKHPGFVAGFLLSTVAASAFADDADQYSPTPSAVAITINVCRDTGFFDRFLNEQLQLTGNCDDADQFATVRLGPVGLQLVGFGTNAPISLKLRSDTQAKGFNIRQFGMGGHTGTFNVVGASVIDFGMQSTTGSCSGIANGGSRCVYDVETSNCSNVVATDRVCHPCSKPKLCPDYSGVNEYWVSGTPTQKCSLTLKRVASSCSPCTGANITPVQQ